jgi:tRNA dimethylallyltransferase
MKVIFVVGPTASGKSQLALKWALQYGGAIINCDSVQVYQGLDVGSAKPSVEERQSCPHELFDYIPPGESITAGSYSRDFYEAIEKLKGKVPVAFVVGGTGFYFQAIEKGMYSIGASNPEVQKAIEAEIAKDPAALYQELQEKDPIAARRISAADHYRLGRALEIIRTHGRTLTSIQAEFENKQDPFPYPLLKLGIKAGREELLKKVTSRTTKMLENGLLADVEGLIKAGFREWTPLESVGYKEAKDYLTGRSSAQNETELEALITTATLQLAKKQRTWFQRDEAIHWASFVEASVLESKIESFL